MTFIAAYHYDKTLMIESFHLPLFTKEQASESKVDHHYPIYSDYFFRNSLAAKETKCGPDYQPQTIEKLTDPKTGPAFNGCKIETTVQFASIENAGTTTLWTMTKSQLPEKYRKDQVVFYSVPRAMVALPKDKAASVSKLIMGDKVKVRGTFYFVTASKGTLKTGIIAAETIEKVGELDIYNRSK